MTPARVNEIGQGRVWDGGTAHQIGLVDRFGTLADAVAEAARRAKLDPATVRPVYLEKAPKWTAQLAKMFASDDDEANEAASITARDPFSRIAADRRALFAQAIGDARRLATGSAIQARCLECAAVGPVQPKAADMKLADMLMARLFG